MTHSQLHDNSWLPFMWSWIWVAGSFFVVCDIKEPLLWPRKYIVQTALSSLKCWMFLLLQITSTLHCNVVSHWLGAYACGWRRYGIHYWCMPCLCLISLSLNKHLVSSVLWRAPTLFVRVHDIRILGGCSVEMVYYSRNYDSFKESF